MPTVLRLDGVRVMIYTEDHPPAHVHVHEADAQAVFVLNCPSGPPKLRGGRGSGLVGRTAARMSRILQSRVPYLCMEWERIHGRD